MAHLAFLAPPYPGHMNPMLALAAELVGRGHRATFLHMPDAGAALASHAVGFWGVGSGSHPPGRLAAMLARLRRADTPLGLRGVIRDVADTTSMLCRELPVALRAIGADALVCDQTEAAGGLVARHLDLPFVSVANALPLNREPAVPPPFTGWDYDPSPWGLGRNAGGYRISDILMRPHRRVIAAAAARWRLGPLTSIEDCVSPLAEIAQTVAGFDLPRAELPATFHHCGPLRDRRREAAFSLPPSGGRPLVYGSLGTLQGSRPRLFRTMCRAAAASRAALVLSHGGGLSPEQIARLPGDPTVFSFVPQPAVLAGASAAILNGGLNTVMDALAAGVPIVALPIAFEQGAVAARIVRSGAGLHLTPRFLSARRLAGALDRVLAEDAFREAAAGLSREIAGAGGVVHAADIVEKVLATGCAVTRDDVPARGANMSNSAFMGGQPPPHAEVPARGRPRSTGDGCASFEARLRRAPQDEEDGSFAPSPQERAA